MERTRALAAGGLALKARERRTRGCWTAGSRVGAAASVTAPGNTWSVWTWFSFYFFVFALNQQLDYALFYSEQNMHMHSLGNHLFPIINLKLILSPSLTHLCPASCFLCLGLNMDSSVWKHWLHSYFVCLLCQALVGLSCPCLFMTWFLTHFVIS